MPSGQQFAYFAAIFGAGMLALAMAVFVFLPVIIIAPAKCALSAPTTLEEHESSCPQIGHLCDA